MSQLPWLFRPRPVRAAFVMHQKQWKSPVVNLREYAALKIMDGCQALKRWCNVQEWSGQQCRML